MDARNQVNSFEKHLKLRSSEITITIKETVGDRTSMHAFGTKSGLRTISGKWSRFCPGMKESIYTFNRKLIKQIICTTSVFTIIELF